MLRKALCLGLLISSTLAFGQLNLNKLKDKAKASLNGKAENTVADNTSVRNASALEDYVAEMVFTNAEYKTFDEAKPHAVQSVKDGDPLYAYVKFPQPVVKYVAKSPVPEADGSVKYQLVLAVGSAKDPDGQPYNNQVITKTKSEFEKHGNELVFILAPFKNDPRMSRVFLETVGGGNPGRWENDVRIFAYKDEGGKAVYARAPLLCDVEDGIVKYKKMLGDAKTMAQKGTEAENTLPEKGKFVNETHKAAIVKRLKNSGITPNKFYFGKDDWEVLYHDGNRTPMTRRIPAVFTYKKDGKAYYGVAWVINDYNAIAGKYGEYSYDFDMDFPIKGALY